MTCEICSKPTGSIFTGGMSETIQRCARCAAQLPRWTIPMPLRIRGQPVRSYVLLPELRPDADGRVPERPGLGASYD